MPDKWSRSPRLLRRRHRSGARGDQPVMLDAAMRREIEDRRLVEARIVEIDGGGDQLVADRLGEGDDLARGRDDAAAALHVDALLAPRLRRADDESAVLVGAGLHGEVVVEHAQRGRLLARPDGIADRRVVAEHDELDALQPHDAIGLGPAPVVADAHAHDAAERPPHREAEIAGLEIALLEMLPRPLGIVLAVARQMDLAIGADDGAAPVDESRAIVAMRRAALDDLLGIAEIEGDAERRGGLEEPARFRHRDPRLEET